ncbi:MAG: hypothetical protein KME54_00470 [Tolypothrix brevis GSE-NOS-MK-07-07A]|jgi:hypothetical protein|nr:hypothetical protein [Tolypothrix brevis GSE-NOS-MK-07-07A]
MDEFEKPPITDASFALQVEKLHRLTVYGRWLLCLLLWITLAPICLWSLREEIVLWQQYFTWMAVRYALFYHPFSSIGLAFCIGMTTAVLVWQSRNILMGLPHQEQQRLEKQVCRIRQQGSSHPLWKWIVNKS